MVTCFLEHSVYSVKQWTMFARYGRSGSSKLVDCPIDCTSSGRSINKLQNDAIPLILKIGIIRNIRFVGNLTVELEFL